MSDPVKLADSDELRDLLSRIKNEPCNSCRQERVLIDSQAGRVCKECFEGNVARDRVAAQWRAIEAQLQPLVLRMLRRAGMSTRELHQAQTALIPGAVSKRVPKELRAELTTAMVASHGFGLSGGAGTGKTFALAAWLKEGTATRLRQLGPVLGNGALQPLISWQAWPETVNRMRGLSMQDGGLEEAEKQVRTMMQVKLLVIDDIGAERMRGSYDEDWMASQLDAVIDGRYRELRPTWYTTNLSQTEFIDRYGARLFSRLCSENPFIPVSAGPDLRMVKGGAR